MNMDNKNVILGSIAIITVVIFALILLFPKGKEAYAEKIDVSKVKVYKHIEKTDDKDGYYTLCNLDTEDVVKVNNFYKNVSKLDDDRIQSNGRINGDYKIVIDDNFIAFDKDNSNVLFNSAKNKLYYYESTIYDIVIKSCE